MTLRAVLQYSKAVSDRHMKSASECDVSTVICVLTHGRFELDTKNKIMRGSQKIQDVTLNYSKEIKLA